MNFGIVFSSKYFVLC